jgi:hypothetical protein
MEVLTTTYCDERDPKSYNHSWDRGLEYFTVTVKVLREEAGGFMLTGQEPYRPGEIAPTELKRGSEQCLVNIVREALRKGLEELRYAA